MDKVTEEVVDLKKEWDQTVTQLEECIAAFKSCGSTGIGTQEAHSLPRLNRAAKDGMQLLKTMQFRLDFLAQQLPTFEEVQSAQATLESWEQQQKMLRASLNNAKFQAKENITKAAREERELLLGCGEESTLRRRNLQTKAEMTSAAQSVTESLRSGTKCKYVGNFWIIFVIGSVLFSLAVLYVVSKRIGLLPLQRRLTNAVRSLSVSAEDVVVAQHGAPVHAHDL
ncbi:hypothetical protein PR202_gb09273 [Eleusine coracana subsp. coracana]|uniref:Uncharacterized protein n=1 Tax=Eleusine coracana subsp. coracana TaxID=191504 RepID=A0AAV5EHK1_ELECO|nr:hypothetical protein PR202_gb09273 [Eleusine coracana subsp. coracana]